MWRRAGLSLELSLCQQVRFLVDASDGKGYFTTVGVDLCGGGDWLGW